MHPLLRSSNLTFKKTETELKKFRLYSLSSRGGNALHVAALGVVDTVEKMTLLFKHHVDPNQQEPSFKNTPLHILIANEDADKAIAWLKKINFQLDFSVCDINERTSLILAVMTKQTTLAKELLPYLKKEILDHRDINGLTALHYSIALGQVAIAAKLCEKGADQTICDILGRKPSDMLDTPEDELRAILSSVSIDPDRAFNARYNHLRDSHGIGFNELQGPDLKQHSIVSARTPETEKQLKSLLGARLVNSYVLLTEEKIEELTNEQKSEILAAFNALGNKTFIQSCLDGRALVNQVLNRYNSSAPS